MSAGTTGRTLVAGVIGQPVAHSLSPLIHTAWIAAAGLDAVVCAAVAGRGRLRRPRSLALTGFRRPGLQRHHPVQGGGPGGRHPRRSDGQAAGRRQPAAVRRRRRRSRPTTPTATACSALSPPGARFRRRKPGPVVILGAGGAARGAAAACLKPGRPEVRIVNRTLARAEAIGRCPRPRRRGLSAGRRAQGLRRRDGGDQRHLGPGSTGPRASASRLERPCPTRRWSWTWSTSRWSTAVPGRRAKARACERSMASTC